MTELCPSIEMSLSFVLVLRFISIVVRNSASDIIFFIKKHQVSPSCHLPIQSKQ